MRGRTPFKLAIGTTAIALIAAGCNTAPPAEDAETVLRIYASEPAFLLPMSADDDPSIQVIREMYRGLVSYDNDTGEWQYDLAESIESDDATTWTVTLKQGYVFTNDEPVNSDSFIRAWNYAAYGPNAQNNAYFMSRIAGIDEVSGESPTAEELSGLSKIDDYTFEVTLTEPFAAFPATLGYSGFFPVAEACMEDLDACNETPIGNGPYTIDGSWVHNERITLVKNDKWIGDPSQSDTLQFNIYGEVDAGWAAFEAGDLDVMYTLPPGEYADAKAALGDNLYERPSDSFTYLGFPLYNPAFEDVRVRQAFSLAIDRQAIIDAVFNGRFTVAKSVVSPLVPGSRENACKYCEYNVDEAKRLLAEAGGWKGGKIQFWFNAGAGHDQWMQAVGNQLKTNLGIDYELKGDLQFAEYLQVADEKKFTGPFRLGWLMDYPSPENYLKPLYGSQGTSNNTGYANKEFDSLVAKGDNAKSVDEAITFYQQAEDIVLKDMPVIPMWFGKTSVLKGENIDIVYNQVNELVFETATIGS